MKRFQTFKMVTGQCARVFDEKIAGRKFSLHVPLSIKTLGLCIKGEKH
jgi:hypothetical protein